MPAAAIAAVSATALLARQLDFDDAGAVDRRVRHLAQSPAMDSARFALWPLFPLGLPGGYLTIAYATARWLHRRRRGGGPRIVTAAWLGWLVHRAVKLGYRRERPRRADKRRRTDSFPSGHTTGTTALALTTAYVLYDQRLVSARRAAVIAVGGPLAMGAYRVIADDHWMTDVVGGWMLGAAIALSCGATLAERSGHESTGVIAAGREAMSPRTRRRVRSEPRSSTT